MDSFSNITDSLKRIPTLVWVIGSGIVVILALTFVFGVSLSTSGPYVFYALFIGSHFFMHSNHKQRGNHRDHQPDNTNLASTPSGDLEKNEHTGHSGGCH